MKKHGIGSRELALATVVSLFAIGMPGTAAAIEFVCNGLGPSGEFQVGTECEGSVDFYVDLPIDAPEFGQYFGTVDVTLKGQQLNPTTAVTEYAYRLRGPDDGSQPGLSFATTRFEVAFEEPLSLLTVGFLDEEDQEAGDIAPSQTFLVKDCFGADYVFGVCPAPGVELALGYQADFNALDAGETSQWLKFLSTTFPVHADGTATGSSDDNTRTLIGHMSIAGPGGMTASAITIAAPEPGTLFLLGIGMVGLFAAQRRFVRTHSRATDERISA